MHNDSPGIVEALIVYGADIEARHGRRRLFGDLENTGSTPLHLAASNSDPTTIEALLDAGADPSATDDDCNTPGDLAASREEIKSHPVFWRLNDARFENSDCQPPRR